jgi:hypothetical protein
MARCKTNLNGRRHAYMHAYGHAATYRSSYSNSCRYRCVAATGTVTLPHVQSALSLSLPARREKRVSRDKTEKRYAGESQRREEAEAGWVGVTGGSQRGEYNRGVTKRKQESITRLGSSSRDIDSYPVPAPLYSREPGTKGKRKQQGATREEEEQQHRQYDVQND